MMHDGDNQDDRKGAEDSDLFPFGAESASDAWLADHPHCDDDLMDLLRFRQLCQALPPREPDEADWNTRLSKIHQAIGRPRALRPWWGIVMGGAAAAVLALLLAHAFWPTPAPPSIVRPSPHEEEPFPVAEAGDVTILTMDARDGGALVVGELPVAGVLEFARPEDIRVIDCERCPHSGRRARLAREGEVPMFVTASLDPPHDD